jgi:hypothetical protein
MTWSLNELEAEAKKAIRGVGLSWGVSEDGAKAVRWLAAHGVDPLPALSDVLDRQDRKAVATAFTRTETGRWYADAPISPLVLGAAFCDDADRLATRAFAAGPVAQPLLLLPFAARAARFLQRALRLDLCGEQVMLMETGDPVGDLAAISRGDLPEVRCEVVTERLPSSQAKAASTGGITADPQSWDRLSAFVHRTYVPASERSRREGAGAGMTDND